jgi:parallel beta-helix repeat protein
MMGRKVALTTAAVLVVVLSVVLMGGEVGTGRFFERGNHEPIYIYGDEGFTVENGVVSGCGTAAAPYVIEGWRIDAPQADYGIYIDHTTAHFVVRDCTVERARLAGVYFNTVRNGRVERSRIGLSDTAVYLLNSAGNAFRRNVVADSLYGIVMGARSADNVVAGNAFLDNGMNAYDPYHDNLWAEDCRGNYWSDYTGSDRDGDGIGDVPHYRVYDPRPLMAPPVDECGEPEAVVETPMGEPPAVTKPEPTEPEEISALETDTSTGTVQTGSATVVEPEAEGTAPESTSEPSSEDGEF